MRFRNPILETAIILMLTLIVLSAYSFSELNFSIADVEVKKPHIREFLTEILKKDTMHSDSATIIKKTAKDTHDFTPKIVQRILDSTPQRILMVGESMIEGLMFPFKKYGKFNGHTIIPRIWYGSRLLDWGASDTLKKLINIFRPTFIIVSIGSNELFIRNIQEREPYVKRILENLGTAKFIWVGPPNPKKDNGINDMIIRVVGKDRFFVSKYMHFERKRDGVHPKAQQCYKWADSISDWIMAESRYPIKLKRPVFDSAGNMIMPFVPGDTLKKKVVAAPPKKKKPIRQAAIKQPSGNQLK